MTLRSSDAKDIEMVILPPLRDLGDDFKVRRALPSAHRRMVGPFIFFDSFGPSVFESGKGLDVRPHPHIGLATVTFLLEGEIVHRDSLGSVQAIKPGEVNWMTAGSGIVHSERTGAESRASGGTLRGIQTWVALPRDSEEAAPGFAHHKADEIPSTESDGVRMTLIAGAWDGLNSPVQSFSDMVYADVRMRAGASYQVRAQHIERAFYVIEGSLEVVGQSGAFSAGELIVLKPHAEVVLRAKGMAHLMLVGGEPFPEKRHIYWNFVSSSPERIEQAKRDWRQQRFAPVPDEHEFIKLPDEPRPVNYP